MTAKIFELEAEQHPPIPKEGELFKIVEAFGKTIELRYGFYEEVDRHSQYAEPVAIYPNFIEQPQYTDDGIPFVTAMQGACEHFSGQRDEDSGCGDCAHYRDGEEFIGVCGCSKNKKASCVKKVVQNE